jgi:toxin ParE1/3/4
MGHVRTPQAESDLYEIWYFVATKSNSLDTADRLVDSITDRFLLLASHPNLGRARDEDLRPGLRTFPVASTSSFIASKTRTFRSSEFCAAAATSQHWSPFEPGQAGKRVRKYLIRSVRIGYS